MPRKQRQHVVLKRVKLKSKRSRQLSTRNTLNVKKLFQYPRANYIDM